MTSSAQHYAAVLKRRTVKQGARSDYDPCISQPVLDCDLGSLPSTPLVGWMHFNPLGPTMSALFHVPVPEAKEALLTFRFDNPFEHQHAAFGVMPGDVTAAQIGTFALMLFTANGHDSCPLFGSLPTSISHKGNWYGEALAPKFDREITQRLFKAAAHTVWPPDISATCELYRRYKGDPWERTAAEFDAGLRAASTVQAGEENAGFDEALFDEWFELVTDPEHVRSERAAFSAAWQGAIDFRNGKVK
jgi:hypothetical protein